MTGVDGSGVGLVLGAGGPMGWAFHLGVLDGVRRTLGHEPAGAARVVGTSAGGSIAATLLGGATTDDVLASITTPPTDDERERMREAMASLKQPWRRLRPVAPGALRGVGRGRGVAPLVGLLPGGVFPTSPLRRFPIGDLDLAWPSQLWLPAVSMQGGARVVFGRDRHDVAVADALEATSAVPLMFEPKQIGDDLFVDGAVHSSTNADLLVGDDVGTVLISSPMTRPGGGMVRRRARRQLAAEVELLRAHGTRVVVVEPDEALVDLAGGFPRENHEAGPAIVAAAGELTARALEAGPFARRA